MKKPATEPQLENAVITTWPLGPWKWAGTAIVMDKVRHIGTQPTQERARAACIALALQMGAKVKG